jgi:dihydrodipicolinate synthase/N-acetylneuraminate lyase
MIMVAERIKQLRATLRNGVTPAMATPLLPGSYQVNSEVIPQLVNFLIQAGVKGVFAGGTTGEGILLDVDQRQVLHEATVSAAAGRVPVLVHVGHQRAERAGELACHAAAIGADAIAAVTPYFYNLNDDALAAYFHAIASAAPELPLFLYDIPQNAINGVGPSLLSRLSGEIPSLAGMKSSRADVQFVRQLADAMDEEQILLAGNESAALGLLALGADGLISGLSTAVPEPFVALTAAYGKGDMATARCEQERINRVLNLLPANARLGAIKAILASRGIPVGDPAPILSAGDRELWKQIRKILDNDADDPA